MLIPRARFTQGIAVNSPGINVSCAVIGIGNRRGLTHERVTGGDRMLEQIVWRFMVNGPRKTTYLNGVRPQ